MAVHSRFCPDAIPRVLKFNKSYFLIAIMLFVVEVLIARYLHDRIIRPYIGDMLVVILIYAFVKSFLDTPVLPTALAVLAFAFITETLQYFRIVQRLGLQDSKMARIIIGTSFEWADLLVYVIGTGIVLGVEAVVAGRRR